MASAADLEARFFSLSIDMLCIARFDGHFNRLSAAWETTLGFSREELQSRPMFEFVHPDDRQRSVEQNRKVKAGEPAIGFENRYLCKDGSYRWLLWNASADLETQLIYSVARDITERKQAEEQRDRLVHELQAALTDVNQLQAILPVCMYCRKVRDDQNYWEAVEDYISHNTRTQFSHGVCPDCMSHAEAHLL